MKLFSIGVNQYICRSLYKSANNSLLAHVIGISTILYLFGDEILPQVLNLIIFLAAMVNIFRFVSVIFFFKKT